MSLMFILPREVCLRIGLLSVLDNSVLYSIRMQLVGRSLEESCLARQQVGNCAPGFLDPSSVYASRQGGESCTEDLPSAFSVLPTPYLRTACPLRLCVGPAPCRFPGATTRRCRVRLQRLTLVHNYHPMLVARSVYNSQARGQKSLRHNCNYLPGTLQSPTSSPRTQDGV
jgi:hypothetical protein